MAITHLTDDGRYICVLQFLHRRRLSRTCTHTRGAAREYNVQAAVANVPVSVSQFFDMIRLEQNDDEHGYDVMNLVIDSGTRDKLWRCFWAMIL